MVKEAPGPINFTVFLTMFGEKLKGTIMNVEKAMPSRSDLGNGINGYLELIL